MTEEKSIRPVCIHVEGERCDCRCHREPLLHDRACCTECPRCGFRTESGISLSLARFEELFAGIPDDDRTARVYVPFLGLYQGTGIPWSTLRDLFRGALLKGGQVIYRPEEFSFEFRFEEVR